MTRINKLIGKMNVKFFMFIVITALFAVALTSCEDKDNNIRVTDVDLDSFKTTIEVGETVTITGKVTPANHTEDKFTVASSAPAIATVEGNVQGANVSIKVTGVSPGKATIEISTSDGVKLKSVEFEVVGKDNNFTVTFNSNEGSSVAPQTVKSGEKATEPADPTREGYKFDAWYKEAALTNEWKFDTDVVTANITLYAKWIEDGGGNDEEAMQMTMTTSMSGKVSIYLFGSGTANIDWGNGTKVETVISETWDDKGLYSHTYSGTDTHTITVTGDNVIALLCFGIQLTSLDVSKNNALTVLECDNNQLTELDISKNTALIHLDCEKNQLASLDISKNTALEFLACRNNSISEIYVWAGFNITNPPIDVMKDSSASFVVKE